MKICAIVAADVRRRIAPARLGATIRLLTSAATVRGRIAVILGLGCWQLAAAAPQFSSPIIPADPAAAGRELVARLLALRPAENVTNEAVLRVRVSKTNQFEVPVRIEVRVSETNWSTTYSTRGTNTDHAATFTVTRSEKSPNEYWVMTFSCTRDAMNDFKNLPGEQAFIPFAGSDFWLADLGMEFLQWPTQRLLKKELCRGQSCDKLESVAPQGWTNGYMRVVSWFDIDTGGPVLVEAYDAKNKLVKEFKPNDFTKVNGQWQVEELEMNNLRTGSRSYLRFKLK